MQIELAATVPLSGLLLGLVIGAAARWAQFCTLGAIADAVIVQDRRRLRAWILAIAIALLGSQGLHMLGWVDLGQSIYLGGGFGWLGAILGGLLFGLGMALVGTCGFGTLVRLGGGDLRALVDMAILGIFAYLTLSGPLAYLREYGIEATDLALPGLRSPSLVDLAAAIAGQDVENLRPLLVAVLALALLVYCLNDPSFRRARRDIAAAVLIGFAIALAWLATGSLIQDPFDPRPPVSLTFVKPLGDGLLYLMLMSGMDLTFGIASVAGVLAGAHLVARAKGEWHREGFDGDREMTRHFAGSALMGVGGTLALGCTIGQGISGLSTLAMSAPLAFVAIFIGAAFGLRYLEEGTLAGALKILARRLPS
ncbi:MAG: YeeE/YedE family protein [Geminicoccaceae bacterium]